MLLPLSTVMVALFLITPGSSLLWAAAVTTTVQTEINYDGYIKREIAEAERFAQPRNGD